jgi:hypothetical protein
MPCEQKPERVDTSGRARAGSQRQLQTYVNCGGDRFSPDVLASLKPSPGPRATLRWVSPLCEDKFNEYRDEEFLAKLELPEHSRALSQFWPKGGPCWDALAIVGGVNPHGVVLVEAKSHVSELASNCGAKDPASRAKIKKALDRTKQRLGVDPNKDWMNGYYQSANRYAHLLFLRDLGVQAWLVNVYFLKDEHFRDAPATEADWKIQLEKVREEMGLSGEPVPSASELFPEAPNV